MVIYLLIFFHLIIQKFWCIWLKQHAAHTYKIWLQNMNIPSPLKKKNMFSRLNQAKKLLKLLQNTLKASSIYYILVVNFTCFVTFECYQSVKCPCPRLVGQKNACFFPCNQALTRWNHILAAAINWGEYKFLDRF